MIGRSFETEYMQSEVPVGLRFVDLPRGILTLGDGEPRRRTNQLLAFEASKQSFCYLIVTTSQSYRVLTRHTPECRLFRLGENLRINPLDTEALDYSEYLALLAETFKPFAFSDSQWILLRSLLTEVYTSNNQPTPLDLLGKVRDFLANNEATDYTQRKDALFLQRLLTQLTTGPTGACFTGASQPPFSQLLGSGITIVECPKLDREILSFLSTVVLTKACASRAAQGERRYFPPLILLIDDVDIYMADASRRQRSSRDSWVAGLRHWQSRLKDVDTSLHLSADHPSLLPTGTLGQFGTIISHRLSLKEDIYSVEVPLKLSLTRSSPYSAKRVSKRQLELLSLLEPELALMTRPDLQTAIPLRLKQIPKHTTSVGEVQRLAGAPLPDLAPTMLHKDFSGRLPEAVRILNLVREYKATPTALTATLGLPENLVTFLLETLINHQYVRAAQEGSRFHRRRVIAITEKGIRALEELARHILITEGRPD